MIQKIRNSYQVYFYINRIKLSILCTSDESLAKQVDKIATEQIDQLTFKYKKDVFEMINKIRLDYVQRPRKNFVGTTYEVIKPYVSKADKEDAELEAWGLSIAEDYTVPETEAKKKKETVEEIKERLKKESLENLTNG